MSQAPLNPPETPQYLHPVQVLEQFSHTKGNGCLHLTSNSVEWLFYLAQGKLVYASHSIEPVDRLERHLMRLSNQIQTITREVVYQLRNQLENYSSENVTELADYRAIHWLVTQELLSKEEATILVKNLTQEVLETYLLAPSVIQKDWLFVMADIEPFSEFDLSSLLSTCQQRLKIWQSFAPTVNSPWQRPYFFINAYAQQKLSPEQIKKLGKILKGYSFYHLAALLHQDELQLVQQFYPLIENKTVILREPQTPYNKLPRFYNNSISPLAESGETIESEEQNQLDLGLSEIVKSTLPNKVWKIACIDDSQTMLNEISRFLDAENFSVHTIKDSLKALMQVIRVKPDLILLDVSMPHIDGYKLCTLIRKNSDFKSIPIIMVTAKTGLIDRARARMSGANDYMTKPFTQEDLLKMIFRYLT